MKNRILCILLSFCLLLSLTTPVGAAMMEAQNTGSDSSVLKTGSSVSLRKISSGKYTLVSKECSSTQTQGYSKESEMNAKVLHDGELLLLSDNTYLGKAEDSNYIKLDRIDIDVNNFDRQDPVYKEYSISEETLDNIEESIAYAEEQHNDELEISLYAINPDLTETVTINGNRYRNTYEEIRNAGFRPIETTGTGARASLNSAVSFTLTLFSMFNGPINFVSTGVSLLSFFQNQTGMVVNRGTTSDWCYTTMFYDKLVKHTAISRNSVWMEGCVSQKLWINKASVWAFFRDTGRQDVTVHSSINKVKYTKNWDTCYDVTLYNWATGSIRDSSPQMTYNGVVWVFT